MNQQFCADEEPNCAKSFSESIILPRVNFFIKMFLWRKKDIFEGREKTRFFVATDKSRLRFFSPGMFRPWKTKAQVIFSGRFVCARARVRERVREGMREGLRKWERGKGGGKKSEFEDSGWERVKEWVSELKGVREGLREWKEIEKRYKRDNKRGEKKTFGERG